MRHTKQVTLQELIQHKNYIENGYKKSIQDNPFKRTYWVIRYEELNSWYPWLFENNGITRIGVINLKNKEKIK